MRQRNFQVYFEYKLNNRFVSICIVIDFQFSFIYCSRSPARLVDLSVILFVDKTQGQSCSDDMALFRL